MNCPHCNIHIDEHTASPCFNMWVDACVMDWHQIENVEIYLADDGYWHTKDGDFRLRTRAEGPTPDYSDSIAAAWEVVEKLSADGHGCHILKHIDPRGDCLCEFWHPKAIDLGRWCSNHQPTVPLAICRAAIKACCSKEHVQHKPECWKNQARSYLGVGGRLASCTCGQDKIFRTETT